ncbi:MAG: flagellar hook-associated protein FlgL [Porticoccus sp.]|nr:flagellar hook-associated protein FlgL [Porticoccus sp.]
MRISTSQMQGRAVVAMLDNQADVSKTQQQVATGKRILSPSDDAYGSTLILTLNKSIDTHVQYGENANVVEAQITLEESTLTHTIDVMQRIKELAVQASNPTLLPGDRSKIAVEVRELLDETLSTANTVDATSGFIFSGFNVDTAPFTSTEVPVGSGLFTYGYTGDLGQRNVQIGETRFIAAGDPGQSVFMDIPVTAGGTQNVFETIEQFAIDLETGVPNTDIEADLDLALNHFSGFRTQTGSRLNAIDSHRTLNDDIIFQGEKALSSVEDLDYAEAVSRLEQQIAILEASQQSFAMIQNLSLFNYL